MHDPTPVICYPILCKIVGADAFISVSISGTLRSALACCCLLLPQSLLLVQAGTQDAHGLGTIPDLAPLVGACSHGAGGYVCDAHSRGGGVDMLPPRTRCSVRVYLQVAVPNGHLFLVGIRQNYHRGSGCVYAPHRFCGRHSLDPVDASFMPHPAKNSITTHSCTGCAETPQVCWRDFKHLKIPTFASGIALVQVKQLGGKQGCLSTACTSTHLNYGRSLGILLFW
mmetsp:Transcript_6941/g.18643  ORF Transcript_6941/g.18643 Transcript_6941/m.18643 type:complete len:226 (+) Transcript_6941:729-1406(+)